jgi:hypothetical protein
LNTVTTSAPTLVANVVLIVLKSLGLDDIWIVTFE